MKVEELLFDVDLDVFLAVRGGIDRAVYRVVSEAVHKVVGGVAGEIVEWASYGNESTPITWDGWKGDGRAC